MQISLLNADLLAFNDSRKHAQLKADFLSVWTKTSEGQPMEAHWVLGAR